MSWIASLSAISDLDSPFVRTVGPLEEVEDVTSLGEAGLIVGVVGVVRVAEVFDVGVRAGVVVAGLLLTAMLLLGVVITTGKDRTAEDPVDTAETAAEVTAPADVVTVVGVDGPAVNVVGPACVDVHELSRMAPTDKPSSTRLRRLFIVTTPHRSPEQYRRKGGRTVVVPTKNQVAAPTTVNDSSISLSAIDLALCAEVASVQRSPGE